jgi:hypothetical protein
VVTGDFNRDNIPDLVVALNSNSPLEVIFGGNDGTPAFYWNDYNHGPGAVSLAVGDFNGDGKPDLAAAMLPHNNVNVYLGDGLGGFTFDPAGPFATPYGPESLAVGDFNGDGKLDLAVALSDTNNILILLGDGAGDFTPAAFGPVPAGKNPFFVAVGDFNGDGKQDLAVVNYGDGTVSVLLGQ